MASPIGIMFPKAYLLPPSKTKVPKPDILSYRQGYKRTTQEEPLTDTETTPIVFDRSYLPLISPAFRETLLIDFEVKTTRNDPVLLTPFGRNRTITRPGQVINTIYDYENDTQYIVPTVIVFPPLRIDPFRTNRKEIAWIAFGVKNIGWTESRTKSFFAPLFAIVSRLNTWDNNKKIRAKRTARLRRM